MKIWDLNSYKCLNTLENKSSVYSLCLISDHQIACVCFDGSIEIRDWRKLIKTNSFKTDNYLKVDKTKLISCS